MAVLNAEAGSYTNKMFSHALKKANSGK